MRFTVLVAPFLLAAVNAQQPTDAIGSAAQLVSLGNQAISQAVSALRASNNPEVSSILAYYTQSVWGPVTSEIAELTKEAATNSQASATLAAIISQIAPSISALSSTLNAQNTAAVTGSAASSAGSAVSSAASVISSATAAASSSASASSSHNAGNVIQVGAMGATGAMILGLAAFL